MNLRKFTYKDKKYLSNDDFNSYRLKYIEKLSKGKKVISAEDRTIGDYIKESFNFFFQGVLNLKDQEDFLIEVTNTDHMIGTLFTYEDGSQKFAFYTAWGPQYTLSGKSKGLVVEYYQSNSIKEDYIKKILQGWITNNIYSKLKYQEHINEGNDIEVKFYYDEIIQYHKSILY